MILREGYAAYASVASLSPTHCEGRRRRLGRRCTCAAPSLACFACGFIGTEFKRRLVSSVLALTVCSRPGPQPVPLSTPLTAVTVVLLSASGSFLSSCGGLYLCCAATSSLSHRIRRSSEHPFGISTPTAKYSVQSDLLYHRRL
ncbi:hypothetical protein BD311DRAFT_392678 [Dichomitus squalens]|uniref:Uncharacterized protein n=1 Tax=Dichomitus squalens TaxID=114155 RepID=A0A4Q9N016_9APHY|nr:hypothetical protein BD311DRAFT_392678 [Dichomitus squalens]